ncbi:PulJ/GspJ family protein [Ornithinibacillus halotolerans]|nr:prepilin-type N-terminal cleavage/methylation domain-containing protein [Ornithinibacillus halotolerans]
MDNEKGVTLVELLAAIVITAIIGVIGYSVLASGFSTYDRVKEEAKLRDEADLIIATLINELYPLKQSEIKELHVGGTDSYLVLKEDNAKIGFFNNNVIVRNREINLSDNTIRLATGSQIREIGEGSGRYEIKLILESIQSGRTLETMSEIRVIVNTEQEVENDETSNQ